MKTTPPRHARASLCARVFRAALPFAFALPLLVSADIVGPDGLTYPDWTRAGIAGGIPTVSSPLTDLSSRANDATDDSAAIEQAAAALTSGGVVYLGPGTYYLDRPVVITNSGVVLRGAGAAQTRIIFRWGGPGGGPVFTRTTAGSTIKRNTYVQVFADPAHLRSITLKVDNTVVHTVTRGESNSSDAAIEADNPICSLSTYGLRILNKLGTQPATATLTAEVDYTGTLPTLTTSIQITPNYSTTTTPWNVPVETGGVGLVGAITFLGGLPTHANTVSSKLNLTATASRGSNQITLSSGHGYTVGSRLEIQAPPTAAWNAATGNPITFGVHRANQYQVTAVSGNTLTVAGQHRLDFPLSDTPYVRRLAPVVRCGVENLTLEHQSPLWICGVLFSNGWECWAKNVTVLKAGRHPLYMIQSKHGEIRDCVMEDALWKGHGGSAYVGWDQSYDCRMENVTTRYLRHAPIVQWGASGNVIRNSTFEGSDAQFHAGYTNENLFENCRVLSNNGDGGYGGAVYSANDTSHGINGPRNVLYNCDFTAPNDGFYNGGCWFGGGNDDWLLLHNRFFLENEGAIYAKSRSRDHLFSNNVWVMRSPSSALQLDTADSTGIDVIGDTFVGLASDEFLGGLGAPASASGNVFTPTLVTTSLTNPSFESGLTGWTQVEQAYASVVSTGAKIGASCLRLNDTSTASGTAGSSRLQSATYPASPLETWQLRYWARFTGGQDGGAAVDLEFLNSSGTLLRRFSRTSEDYWTTWRRHSITGDAPSGTTACRIVVRSLSTKTVTADFDGFQLGRLPVAIPNPGFESTAAFEGWTKITTVAPLVAVGQTGYSGSKGLRITDTSASEDASVSSASWPASAGRTHQVRFRANLTSGAGVVVWLRFFNSSGTLLSESSFPVPTTLTGWHQHVFSAVAPSGASAACVNVRSSASGGLVADFDDFVVMEGPARPAPATSSIFNCQRGL